MHERLYATEKRNLALFGYGVKGMVPSMLEAAIEITGQRLAAQDVHRIVELGKALLQHPVELLPGIRDAVTAIADDFDIVLITKGDLFHQEAKVRASGLADLSDASRSSVKKMPPHMRVSCLNSTCRRRAS